MITNVSLCTLYVTDQDAAKAFYVDKLGFIERADVRMGDGVRWVTVGHPSQPELEITLMLPGPPLDDELADAVRHRPSLAGLPAHGAGTAVPARRTIAAAAPVPQPALHPAPTTGTTFALTKNRLTAGFDAAEQVAKIVMDAVAAG
jgi:catechol 2,3-dioxygenase-like lactoylglutathione lyase family enzyme